MIKLFVKNFKFCTKQKSGFTLLEVMMAVFIIGVGLVGIASLIAQNARVQYFNKNSIIASQLAQEGLELVRNIRDTNWLIGNDWKNGDGVDPNTDIIQDADGYVVDYLGNINNVNDISGDGEIIDEPGAKLYINSGYYDHNNLGGATSFSRSIKVSEDISGNFINVICVVRLMERNNKYRDYINETTLYNWR